MTVRLVHFSDVHLAPSRLGWTRRDLLTKKVTGWINIRLLGRGYRFRHAAVVAQALKQDLKERGYDHIVFSGDATMLAFESEMRTAAEALGVGEKGLPNALAVPGNHDYYTHDAHKQQLFEQHFGAWQQGERIGDHVYPFAQKVGHVWLIGINSSAANWWTFDASGRVGREQIERLKQLCDRLDDGPRIVVTHYPLRTAKGQLERSSHRLRDHQEALAAAIDCKVSLWLHGHIHRGYVLSPTATIPFPVICVGSLTQSDRWSYNEYTITDNRLILQRREFDHPTRTFQDQEIRTFELKNRHA